MAYFSGPLWGKINGTYFEGCKDLITTFWGTKRKFTIGKQTIEVDGAEDVNFDLNSIGTYTKDELDKLFTDTTTNITNYVNSEITKVNTTIKNEITTVNNTINNVKTELTNYADNRDFLNFPPRIGYMNDDNEVDIYGRFNFAVGINTAAFMTTDNQNRDIFYYIATDGLVGSPNNLFKAVKYSSEIGFIFKNDLVFPSNCPTGSNITALSGVGNNWIVFRVNTGELYLCIHDGSSDASTWTEFIPLNIPIAEHYLCKVQYIEKHKSVIVNTYYGGVYYISIFNPFLNTYILNPTSIFSADRIYFNNTDYVFYSKSLSNYGRSCILYNPDSNKLVLMIDALCYWTVTSTGQNSYRWQVLLDIFDFPETLFTGDTSNIDSILPDEYFEYSKINSGAAWSAACITPVMTYDRYNKRILTTVIPVQNAPIRYQYWISSSKDKIDNYSYPFLNYTESKSPFNIPDSSKWHKSFGFMNYFYNNYLYFVGNSSKNGSLDLASLYNKNEVETTTLSLLPGEYWERYPIEDYYLGGTIMPYRGLCRKISDEESRFWVWLTDSKIYEVKHTIDPFEYIHSSGVTQTHTGKRIIEDTLRTLPSYPINTSMYTIGYDGIRDRLYCTAYDTINVDTSRQGFVYLLIYDYITNTWSNKIESSIFDVFSQRSKSGLGNRASFSAQTNFFINTDDKIYISLAYSVSSNTNFSPFITIDPDTHEMTSNTGWDSAQASYRAKNIIWDPTFGYHFTVDSGSRITPEYITFINSKSLDITKPEYTLNQIVTGSNYYVYRLYTGTPEGLVAQLMSCVVFLGGYYSMTSETELPLTANSDNYVYFTRGTDRDTIDITVSTEDLGIKISFSKILVAKITTDGIGIVSQETYPINTFLNN